MRLPRLSTTMPDTSTYYHVAYTLALGIYVLYGLSLYVRRRKLRRGQ